MRKKKKKKKIEGKTKTKKKVDVLYLHARPSVTKESFFLRASAMHSAPSSAIEFALMNRTISSLFQAQKMGKKKTKEKNQLT
jgi:hypothetical protein